MGLRMFSVSSSRYDWRDKSNQCGQVAELQKKLGTLNRKIEELEDNPKTIVLPNPDPTNYAIRGKYVVLIRLPDDCLYEYMTFMALWINYPDCKNYEGNKVLVFEGCNVEELDKQGSVDPHFCDNPKFHSPIARFQPTKTGWQRAKQFIDTIIVPSYQFKYKNIKEIVDPIEVA